MNWTDKRYTKIICTIGPASMSEPVLDKMASRGMDIARLNFSHGTHKTHQQAIDLIRLVNDKYGHNIKILQDLEGHRLRLGVLKRPISLKKNQVVHFCREEDLSEKNAQDIPIDMLEDISVFEEGKKVFIDDGNICVRIVGPVSKKRVQGKVLQPGTLKSRKGVNIPKIKLKSNIMTDQDKRDLEFGITNNLDYIAQSFVRNKKDISRVVDIVRKKEMQCKVIAKVETADGIKNINNIIDACDGVMVARGDLGVMMPIYKLPIIQKYIIRRCNRKRKLSITATQMLESMIENGRPTRAEVSDIANAILDGTDYVMLSGETAVGKYPSRCVKVMSQIINYTEHCDNFKI